MSAQRRGNDPRGYVNAHTHLYSGLAPLGMPAPATAPKNFVEILQKVWWRLDRALDAASLRASARLYVAEALLAGTTTLVDHHESPNHIEGSLDVLANACDQLGVRALLCYGVTERNGGRDEARAGLRECERFLRENDRATVRGAVGVHASFTVSDETLGEAGALAREWDAPLHLHLAEDSADVADARERGYDGPLERLLALDALPAHTIFAHGVHLDESQVRMAVDRGAWFVQNPRSNRGNGVGYASSLHATDRVALGTDGYPADMREELQALVETGAAHDEIEGAGLRRLEKGHALVASLMPGTGHDDDRVEFHGDAATRVQVAGRTVVDAGRLLTADLESIQAEARAEAARLWPRMQKP